MKYTTVYDYYSTLSSQKYIVVFLAISVALLFADLIFVKRTFVDNINNDSNKIVLCRMRSIFLLVILFCVVVSFALCLTKPSEKEIKQKNIRSVSGEVYYFHPDSRLSTSQSNKSFHVDSERFYVDDTFFQYDYVHFWYPGYKKTYYFGGAIRKNGQIVRITYYYDAERLKNIIIKLEVTD